MDFMRTPRRRAQPPLDAAPAAASVALFALVLLASPLAGQIGEILVVDPAVRTMYPNLPGGITDSDGTSGPSMGDPRFVDSVSIITTLGTGDLGYFPSCPSCTLQRAIEFGPNQSLPAGVGGSIHEDTAATRLVFQVAQDTGQRNAMGCLDGFSYIEQSYQIVGGQAGPLIGDVRGDVMFVDTNGDSIIDRFHVDHQGDQVGQFGLLPFMLDIDVMTMDLNSDGLMDVATIADFFNVWRMLGGNPQDPAGQVYLPIADSSPQPGFRTLVFNDAALDTANVVGPGGLPCLAPLALGLAAPGGPAAIPTLSNWLMMLLFAALASTGLYQLRRGGRGHETA